MLRFASFYLCPVLAVTAVSACDSASEPIVEVRPHERFVVILSEISGIPVGPLSDQVILAGRQYFLVSHLDSEGRQLYRHGLAELGLSPRLKLCDEAQGSLDVHCLSIEEPGSHVLQVSVDDETLVLPFRAVLESDITGIELLQPNEEELLPGTWVQIDAVGVTVDGMHVAAIHPRFEVGKYRSYGYFAYQYDPDAPLRTLNVSALDRHESTQFRGVPSEKNRFPSP